MYLESRAKIIPLLVLNHFFQMHENCPWFPPLFLPIVLAIWKTEKNIGDGPYRRSWAY